MSKKKTPKKAVQTDLLGTPLTKEEAEEREAKSAPPETPPAEKRTYQPNPVVNEVPATCPRCGSTDSRVLKTTAFPRRPLHINGKTYPGRVCRRRMCKQCACRFVSNAPISPKKKPAPPSRTKCKTCKGVGALPRSKTRKKIEICPDCKGTGTVKRKT